MLRSFSKMTIDLIFQVSLMEKCAAFMLRIFYLIILKILIYLGDKKGNITKHEK